MTHDEIAKSLEASSLTYQLAASAAVQELLTLPAGDPAARALKLAMSTAYGRMRGTYGKFATVEPTSYSEADKAALKVAFPSWFEEAASNVIPIPVKPRTSWTVLRHLDGRRWTASSGFSPGGAWSWILETVSEEHGCDEDAIDCKEDPEGGDDFVTIDGLPVYRIEHTVSHFEDYR